MSETKKLVRGFEVAYPVFQEQSYTKQLLQLVAKLKSLTTKFLLRDALFKNSFNHAIRKDDVVDDLNAVLRSIEAAISLEVAKAINSLSKRYKIIREFSEKSFSKSIAHIASISRSTLPPLAINVPDLRLLRKMWLKKNTELIKSIPKDALSKVADMVSESVRRGESMQSLTKKLSNVFDITNKRAKVIARDQIAKLKSDLSRHDELKHGLTLYEWSTAKDDAVRAAHNVLDGKICSWIDPTIYKDTINQRWKKRSSIGATTKHVGEDILCRCTNIIIAEGIA